MPGYEGLDLLVPLLSRRVAVHGSFLGGFRLADLLVVLVVHHVLQQHGDEAPQEGLQHARLHRGLAEGAPELARLQGHALVAVLRAQL